MKRVIVQALILTSIFNLYNFSLASTTGFEGVQVDTAIYCCTSTNESQRVSDIVSAIVGNTVEYPINQINGERIIAAAIDIGDKQISVDFNQSSWTTKGEFNGYVFDFSPLSDFPEIASISLNALTTFLPGEVSLDFYFDRVSISLPGLYISTDSHILVDVTFVEPPLNNDCVVIYTITESLNIPCLAISKTRERQFAADMNLSPWPGCDYRIDSVSSLNDQVLKIEEFRTEFDSKKQECEISIVHYAPIEPTGEEIQETWIISGFDDNEDFKSVELEAENTNLITELQLPIQDKSTVTNAITSILGRTPTNDPLAYTLVETREIERPAINIDNCLATFDLNGLLVIPCIDIHDSQGDIDRYQAIFEIINDVVVPEVTILPAFLTGDIFSSQTTFRLISSGKIIQ